jgi:predicted patatin/cPLA2 family phospholipase
MQKFFAKIKKFLTKVANFQVFGEKKRLMIIMSGGAMNCAYGAGMLSALEDVRLPKGTVIIAASGNAGNATYFASGQVSVGKDIWVNYLAGSRMINYNRKKILDVDYVIDEVFKKAFPLDLNNLRNSNLEVIVPAMCYETGGISYFSSKEADLDWFEILRAAKALPVVYGKRIKIGNLHYFDTPYSSSWDVHVEKVKSLGATDLIILDLNKLYPNEVVKFVGEYVTKNFFFPSVDIYKPAHLSNKADYQKDSEHNVYIRPKHLLNNLETDQKLILEMWNAGYADTKNNKHLQQMLQSL